ncbi:MAG TPA: hypothetical protein VHM19_20250, partial [Polyangiales bacterium]|nr:hypothetical protein [Polyangiales bacterium]
MPTERTRRAAALCLAYALLFSWVLRPLWDIDVFLHVAIGREIAAHGIPSRDVFSSATPDAAYTPFQVGYELLVAKLDALGGIELVRVIDAALCAGAMLLLLVRLRQLTGSRAATFALFALFLLLYDDRIRPRPHLCNLWFEVALLLPLASARFAVGNRRHWLTLFALGALWSTLHAMGALWLIAVLGCFVVAGDEAQRRWAFGAAACALAGILLAPGALGGILHVLRIQDQWREFVPELAPTWAFLSMHDSYGYAIAILPWAAALSVVYAAAQAPAREHWPRLLCAAGFAWSGLWLARLCYYAVFAVLLV